VYIQVSVLLTRFIATPYFILNYQNLKVRAHLPVIVKFEIFVCICVIMCVCMGVYFTITALEYSQYCYDATWTLAYTLNQTLNSELATFSIVSQPPPSIVNYVPERYYTSLVRTNCPKLVCNTIDPLCQSIHGYSGHPGMVHRWRSSLIPSVRVST